MCALSSLFCCGVDSDRCPKECSRASTHRHKSSLRTRRAGGFVVPQSAFDSQAPSKRPGQTRHPPRGGRRAGVVCLAARPLFNPHVALWHHVIDICRHRFPKGTRRRPRLSCAVWRACSSCPCHPPAPGGRRCCTRVPCRSAAFSCLAILANNHTGTPSNYIVTRTNRIDTIMEKEQINVGAHRQYRTPFPTSSAPSLLCPLAPERPTRGSPAPVPPPPVPTL